MKIFGYCRISRKEQNIERQERNILAAYPDAVIVKEAYTGTRIEGRKAFERLIERADNQTLIVFDSVSRMSRNAQEGFQVYQDLYARGVELVFLKEPQINTSTYKASIERSERFSIDVGDEATKEFVAGLQGILERYIMRLAEQQIKLAFQQAEKEVKDLHQRTKEGIETARLAGKQIGQEKGRKLTVKKAQPAKDLIRKHSKDFDGTLSDKDVMKLAGIANNTYYKYKKELRTQLT